MLTSTAKKKAAAEVMLVRAFLTRCELGLFGSSVLSAAAFRNLRQSYGGPRTQKLRSLFS
jgi:hypothetical protein